MNDPVLLRRYVREVMALGATRAWTTRKIFDGVQRLARDPLSVDELQQALRWNESKGYVASEADEDAALPGQEAPLLWTMTAAGKAKEGLS